MGIEVIPDWDDDEWIPAWAERDPKPRGRMQEPEVFMTPHEPLIEVLDGEEVVARVYPYRRVRFGFQRPGQCYLDEETNGSA